MLLHQRQLEPGSLAGRLTGQAKWPAALFPSEVWAGVLAMAERVPLAWGRRPYFEMDLAADSPRVDLSVEVGPDGAPALFSQYAELQSFGQAWMATPRHLGLWVGCEFDSDRGGHPNLYFDWRFALDPDLERGQRLLSALQGRALSDSARQAIRRACQAVGPSCMRAYLGAKLARPGAAGRLVLQVDPRDLAAFLGRAGWSGPHEWLATAEGLTPHCDFLAVHLYIGGSGLLPDLGLEFHTAKRRQPRWEPRWLRLLGELEALGLVDPAKSAEIAGLPVPLGAADALVLNALKLSFPSRTAKVYTALERLP